jgi:tetratricopeptide (TPR) repeat protein/tRNA A-37 threonylcarbamoyl transferase component Bud32
MDCLDDNQVLAYVEHEMDAAALQRVAEHLDTCERCLALTCAVAATMSDATPNLEAAAKGNVIGRYSLIEMIGRGAMGGVYVAMDPSLSRKVALKVVRTARFVEPTVRARLAREAKAMAQITHPNVIAVYDTGELDDGVFIAMELITGEHLAAWTARPGRTWREIVRVYAAAGRGLAAAHAAGIVHRDFKPANVMIDAAGRVAVGDFGLALAETDEDGVAERDATTALGDPLLTRTGALLGTPRYMSAEHFDGEVDARSDQFGFAVALYEALYGKPPFEGASVIELRKALEKPVPAKPPNPAVPIAIHRAIVRALAVDPAKRWPSMNDMVDALDVAIRPSSTKWFVAFALAVTAAVVGGAVIVHELKKPAPVVTPVVAPTTMDKPAARMPIFVAPFVNKTGDKTLDDTLDLVVGTQLTRSTRADVAASFALEAAVAGLGGSLDHLEEATAKIHKADGRVVMIVRGTVEQHGTTYSLTLDASDARLEGGAVHARATDVSRDQLTTAVVELANQLRRAMHDPDVTWKSPMSKSLEALHELVAGQSLDGRGEHTKASEHVRSALQFDSDLVEAHALLGNILYNASERVAAIGEYDRAVGMKERVGERDRYTLLGDYYGAVGRYSDAIAAYQQLLARWPGDGRTQINVTATALDAQSWPLALDLARNAAHDHPTLAVTRGNLILAEVANNRFDEAARDGDAMLHDLPHPAEFATAAVIIAHELIGETKAAHETLLKLTAINADLAVSVGADLAMFEGKPDDAEHGLRPFLDRNKVTETRATRLILARLLEHKGDHERAVVEAKLVRGEGTARIEYLAAQILVAEDKLPDAASVIASWTANDIAEWRMFGHVLAGDVALHHGDGAGALREYAEAEHHGPSWVIHAQRARAYLAAGDHEHAGSELDWCKAHRGEIAVFLTPSMSLLRELPLP